MSSPFRIEEAREEDIGDCMAVVMPAFAHMPFEPMMGNFDTPEGRKDAGERHLRAWREHLADNTYPCPIKCIHTDPSTGEETIVGFAEWFIYDKERTKEEYTKDNFLLSMSWLPEEDGQRGKIKDILKPIMATRNKWFGGKPYALLMYMAVDEKWRRKGVSSRCVQWGLDKCQELGIPAYLEASDEGEPVYKKLGFVEVEQVELQLPDEHGSFPAMVKWPIGMKEEDKKPVMG